MDRVDCVVIGAGVIGLAIARELALAGRETIVLEAEKSIGVHASSRNSEVIHAGIYYPPGSLKARFCVAGKKSLYQYCSDRGISHKRIGKLIVAGSEAQAGELQNYHANAVANGVTDLSWLDESGIRAYEPDVLGIAALYSPSTGIIDSHAYLQALQADLEAAGGSVVCHTPVNRVKKHSNGFIVLTGVEDGYSINCKYVINAAGSGAQRLAAATTPYERELIPGQQLIQGQYYSLSGQSPFHHLIYPLASSNGLGIHVTLDQAGQARFGPDARTVDQVDYAFDHSQMDLFVEAIREYYPSLDAGKLQPGYCGIRAALSTAGSLAADFIIQGPADHGIDGLVHLYGIDSPGLTASLAIAEHVNNLLI